MYTKKNSEPFVELATGEYFANTTNADLILANQQMRQAEKYQFYRLCFDYINENSIYGDYHEYGVHKARTFRMALTEARRQDMEEMQFFAFDSFQGLPASNSHLHDGWIEGALTTSEESFQNIIKQHGIYTDKVHTVRGFYDQVLTEKCVSHFLNCNNKIAVVTVDCDLYESAVPVFKFIENLIQTGTVVYIDDYFVGHRGSVKHGVTRAFDEYKNYSRFDFVPFLPVGWWGKSFIANL